MYNRYFVLLLGTTKTLIYLDNIYVNDLVLSQVK